MRTEILLINGPNLNMLGLRRPDIYGRTTLPEIEAELKELAASRNCALKCFQSNHEGAIIDEIQAAYGHFDGIIINPGAFTHYSYAIHDAIESVALPCVEIHISDIHAREKFRSTSVILPACIKQISGHGTKGYGMALSYLLDYISEK